MEKVNIRIYPDSIYGYVVEVYDDILSIPIVTLGNLDKAFAVLESKGFADTVNLFFNF
jgi:hypothetical protein